MEWERGTTLSVKGCKQKMRRRKKLKLNSSKKGADESNSISASFDLDHPSMREKKKKASKKNPIVGVQDLLSYRPDHHCASQKKKQEQQER
jgi:hypothetical protein